MPALAAHQCHPTLVVQGVVECRAQIAQCGVAFEQGHVAVSVVPDRRGPS